jgi:hypothetical protein
MKDDQYYLISCGKSVMVTSSELSARYLLKSINNVRLHFVRHYKYPPLTFIIAGIISVAVGFSGLLPDIRLEEVYIGNFLITTDRLFIIAGTVITFLGFLWLSILQNEYVILISTYDGEQIPKPIVIGTGRKKQELSRIVSVISNAIDRFKKDNLV